MPVENTTATRRRLSHGGTSTLPFVLSSVPANATFSAISPTCDQVGPADVGLQAMFVHVGADRAGQVDCRIGCVAAQRPVNCCRTPQRVRNHSNAMMRLPPCPPFLPASCRRSSSRSSPRHRCGSPAIVSIALLGRLIETAGPQYVFLMLMPGPVLGLAALRRLAAKPA
ncbi:hypothetical protein [Reyranella sp. CPCC 100927]|uniref:hypothetical protein n=1 Tax=Reyranella sp. CPCC 100927 TaxID=2599616 RepID=UPI0011B529A1|nr:hypothetical protein [Reyranella sp. CPCC 100927]